MLRNVTIFWSHLSVEFVKDADILKHQEACALQVEKISSIKNQQAEQENLNMYPKSRVAYEC